MGGEGISAVICVKELITRHGGGSGSDDSCCILLVATQKSLIIVDSKVSGYSSDYDAEVNLFVFIFVNCSELQSD